MSALPRPLEKSIEVNRELFDIGLRRTGHPVLLSGVF